MLLGVFSSQNAAAVTSSVVASLLACSRVASAEKAIATIYAILVVCSLIVVYVPVLVKYYCQPIRTVVLAPKTIMARIYAM
jgi:hypothetical protein